MKKIIACITFLSVLTAAHAQQNFQGQIIYKLHSSEADKPDAELKVLFGNGKLKLWFKEKETYEEDALLIRLDSAATYVLQPNSKTYKRRMLQANLVHQDAQKKSIHGYSTTPFIPESNGLSALLGGFLSTANSVFYVADSLYYTIPEAYAGNKEFLMIQKNKIVLGVEMKLQANLFGAAENDDKKNNTISVEAIEITPMSFKEEEFAIPADFINAADAAATPAMADTAAVDTTAPAVFESQFTPPALPKKTTAKKPVKSNKTKTPVKSAAVRRKQ